MNKKTDQIPWTYSYVGPKPPELEFIESPELQLVREIVMQNSRILEQNQCIIEFLTTDAQFPATLVETRK